MSYRPYFFKPLAFARSTMSFDPPEAIVVFITAPHSEEAARLADMLVGQRLAACVQVLPEMESVYRWQGRIERQKEVLVIAKTTKARFEALDREVRAIHSYETPEIVALPLAAGSVPYLEWLNASVSDEPKGT